MVYPSMCLACCGIVDGHVMMMMRLLLSSQNFPEGLTGKPKAEAALTSRFH